jgi:peptide/nickel transport system substrate-binding protein
MRGHQRGGERGFPRRTDRGNGPEPCVVVNRRRLLGAVAGGAGAAFLAACGGAGGSGTGSGGSNVVTVQQTTGGTPSVEQPVRGGVLNRHSTQDPASLDLHREISTSVVALVAPMFNQLVMLDPHKEGEIIPDLATALPEQPDPTTYTFKLTPNVKFHDGTPLTAEDVVANYEWMIRPPAGEISSRQLILAVVDTVRAVDPTTVQFKLKGPSASFLVNQAVPYVAVGPKAVLARDGNLRQNRIGSGPFKLKDYQPGVVFQLERNNEYFKKDLPYLDGITHFIIKDRNTALENFIAGKIDFFQPFPDQLPDIQQRLAGKAKVVVQPSVQRNHVFMNTEKRPFNDIRVREAISLGCDRQTALAVISGGQGLELGSYMHPQGVWALPEAELTKVPGYAKKADVAKAKAQLAAAGFANGFEARMLYRSIFEATGIYLADQLKQMGITARPMMQETPQITNTANTGDFDIFIWTAAPALDDPDAVMGDIGVSSAPRNWSRIVVPEADDAYARQAVTLDRNQRKTLVNTADRALISNFASVVVGFESLRFAFTTRLRNKSFLIGENYTNQRYEDVWLAKE